MRVMITMKFTKIAEKAGIIWVMFLFTATPVALLFFDYSTSHPILTQVVIFLVSSLVTFCLVAILYWLSQLMEYSLPESWFRMRRKESRQLYRNLGVVLFRDMLVRSPFRVLNQKIHLTNRSKGAFLELETHMRMAETNHVIAFVLSLIATVFYGQYNDARFIIWLTALNLIGNVYPVFLQRYNRIRMTRILDRG